MQNIVAANAAFDQGRHYLHTGISMQNIVAANVASDH